VTEACNSSISIDLAQSRLLALKAYAVLLWQFFIHRFIIDAINLPSCISHFLWFRQCFSYPSRRLIDCLFHGSVILLQTLSRFGCWLFAVSLPLITIMQLLVAIVNP
jgi:hypothetical protein